MTGNVPRRAQRIADSRFSFAKMLERKWLGDKTKGGFYKKNVGRAPSPADPGKDDERLALDWKTLEYSSAAEAKIRGARYGEKRRRDGSASSNVARHRGRWRRERINLIKQATFLWRRSPICGPIPPIRVPEISDSVVEIDSRHAPRLQVGTRPLRTLGRGGRGGDRRSHEKRGASNSSQCRKSCSANGKKSWYEDDPKTPSGRKHYDLATGNWQPVAVPEESGSVEVAKKSNGVVKKKIPTLRWLDLGDGVGCIEFHSKMNALGADIISLILQTLKPGGPGDAFDALRHQPTTRRIFPSART